MSNYINKVDAVILKVEKSALVLVGGGIAAFSGLNPHLLPPKFAAIALVVNNALVIAKPKIQKAVQVTQTYSDTGTSKVVTSFVDHAENVVKHVVTDVESVPAIAKAEVAVVKDQVESAPAAQTQAAQQVATADYDKLKADVEYAKQALATAENAVAAVAPPVPAGPGGPSQVA